MAIDSYFLVGGKEYPRYVVSSFAQDDAICLTEDLARAIADQIVRLRCKRNPKHYASWQIAAAGGAKPSAAVVSALRDFVTPGIGVPTKPPPPDHLEGCVAEHLWYFILQETKDSSGLEHVEPPSLAPTDPGGDGLSIRRQFDGELAFCLWEIKKRTGSGAVTQTINGAAVQLKARAESYLARYTCTAEHTGRTDLEDLYARLSEHWRNASHQASAGISASTSKSLARKRSFAGLPKHLSQFTVPRRLFGQLTTVADFSAFAREVQRIVWTGL